jgi:hypothetical protein
MSKIVKVKLLKDLQNGKHHVIPAGEIVEIQERHLDKYISEGIGEIPGKSKPKAKKEFKEKIETKELKIDSKETKDEANKD